MINHFRSLFITLLIVGSLCNNLKTEDRSNEETENFQERIIYLNEEDNVCSCG